MLGDTAVGKSSLVSQFMTSEYLHAYDTSIGELKRWLVLFLDYYYLFFRVFIELWMLEMEFRKAFYLYLPILIGFFDGVPNHCWYS